METMSRDELENNFKTVQGSIRELKELVEKIEIKYDKNNEKIIIHGQEIKTIKEKMSDEKEEARAKGKKQMFIISTIVPILSAIISAVVGFFVAK